MPGCRGGEHWMCENWLDLPYSPTKPKERRGGAMTTMLIAPDAFGNLISFPLAHRGSERLDAPRPVIGGAEAMSSSAGAKKRAKDGKAATHPANFWDHKTPQSMNKSAFIDPSPMRQHLSRPYTFNDANKVAAFELAERVYAKGGFPSGNKVTMQKEHFVDMSAHKEALKSSPTTYDAINRRNAAQFEKEALARVAAAQAVPVEAPPAPRRTRSETELSRARDREHRCKNIERREDRLQVFSSAQMREAVGKPVISKHEPRRPVVVVRPTGEPASR